MKYLYFVLILFTYSCNEQVQTNKTDIETERPSDSIISINQNSEIDYLSRVDTIILGDINFDKIIDTAIVYPVKFKDPNDIMQGSINGNSITKIHFSHDNSWLYKETAIELIRFYVLDDINEDGVKEIALIPGWYQSCWSGFFVYSNRNGVWQKISSSSVWSCGDLDYKVIKIRKNKFIVPDRTYSAMAEDVIDTFKTVRFPKFEPDVYDVIVDTVSFPIQHTVNLLKPHLRGLVAFYSGIAGSQCDLNGDFNCELTRALNINKQGSEDQVELIAKYLPDDEIAEELIANKCYREPAGASIWHEFNYLTFTDYGNKVVVEYEIMLYNRGTFTNSAYIDSYQFKNNIFSVLERKLLAVDTYTFEDIGIN